jgi:hypothetical protein
VVVTVHRGSPSPDDRARTAHPVRPRPRVALNMVVRTSRNCRDPSGPSTNRPAPTRDGRVTLLASCEIRPGASKSRVQLPSPARGRPTPAWRERSSGLDSPR